MTIPFNKAVGKTTKDGKRGTSVVSHCLATACVAHELQVHFPERFSFLPKKYAFDVGKHDVGKPGKYFQYTINTGIIEEYNVDTSKMYESKGKVKHEVIGAVLYATLHGIPLRKLNKNYHTAIILGHHGVMNGRDDTGSNAKVNRFSTNGFSFIEENGVNIHCSDGYLEEAKKFLDYIEEETKEFELETGPDTCDIRLMTGFINLCDWIASDEDFFPSEIIDYTKDDLKIRAKIAVETIFKQNKFKPDMNFGDIFGFSAFNVQNKFVDMVTNNGRGIYIFQGPMGIGKTEAAEMCIYNLNTMNINTGSVFCAPTRLTSDKICDRFEEFYDKVLTTPSSVRLAHGQSWMKSKNDIYEPNVTTKEPINAWFDPAKRALIYDFVVGTVDQVLTSVLNVKFSAIRDLGLANKVVVFDEVHSFDDYTFSLIKVAVNRLLEIGSTVIILSATLTSKQRKELTGFDDGMRNEYPILVGRSIDGRTFADTCNIETKVKDVKIDFSTSDLVIESAVKDALAGQNVLLIENTVNGAIDMYDRIRVYMIEHGLDESDFPIGLLHSRFIVNDRGITEDEWLNALGKNSSNRPHGSILVSTQIVEQSVNIDVDRLYTRLAPIDCILQRIGRQFRHDRLNRPVNEQRTTVYTDTELVLSDNTTEDDVKTAFGSGSINVYSMYKLLRTYEVLVGLDMIHIPNDISMLIEKCLGEREEKNEIISYAKMIYMNEVNNLISNALSATGDKNGIYDDNEDNAKTRYSDYETVPFIIVRRYDVITNDEIDIEMMDGTKIRVNRNYRNKNVHKTLIGNHVNAPGYMLNMINSNDNGDQSEVKDIMQKYFKFDMPILLTKPIDSSDSLCYNGVTLNMNYNSKIGLYTNR